MAESAFKFRIDELAERHKGQDVILVGNGDTGQAWQLAEGDARPVWVLNSGFRQVPAAGLIWSMDDIKGPAWDAHRQKDFWLAMLRNSEIPIITARAYEEFPASCAYPIYYVMGR